MTLRLENLNIEEKNMEDMNIDMNLIFNKLKNAVTQVYDEKLTEESNNLKQEMILINE